MKKIITLMISIVLITAIIATGCQKEKAVDKTTTTESEKATEVVAEEDSLVTDPGTFPITKEPYTLKILVKSSPFVEDYTTNEFTKWYEEKTNVKIEWTVVSGDQAAEKINLLLAGGEYPDIILNGITKEQAVLYGIQGAFLPVNDLIDQYGFHIKEALNNHPEMVEQAKYVDGNLYFTPKIGELFHTQYINKFWVYQPWLDKLGLEVPTTTDEFYNMLKAFKEEDPNGNGKADEIPYMGRGIGGGVGILNYIMGAFAFSDSGEKDKHLLNDYIVKDGKVVFGPAEPGYKEGLEFIKKLWDEGLIANDSVTIDRKQITALGESETPVLGASTGVWFGMFTTNDAPSGRFLDYTAIPPLKGPSGVQSTAHQLPQVAVGPIITENCKDPEVAVRWLDWFYSMEGNHTAYAGLENVGWRKATETEKGYDGNPALYRNLVAFGEIQNTMWSNTTQFYEPLDYRQGVATDDLTQTEGRLYNITKNLYEPFGVTMSLPPLYMSELDMQELAELDTAIYKTWSEGIVKVLMGNDAHKDWDQVLENLNDVGLQESIELRQKAYEQYLNK